MKKPFVYNPYQIKQQEHAHRGIEPLPVDIVQNFCILFHQHFYQCKAGENAEIIKHLSLSAFGIGIVNIKENTYKRQHQILKTKISGIGLPKQTDWIRNHVAFHYAQAQNP